MCLVFAHSCHRIFDNEALTIGSNQTCLKTATKGIGIDPSFNSPKLGHQMLLILDLVFGHGVVYHELRSLAMIRELCTYTRHLFEERLAPIRSLSCFLDSTGSLFLEPEDMGNLAATSVDISELTRIMLLDLRDQFNRRMALSLRRYSSDSEDEFFNQALMLRDFLGLSP